MRTWWTWVWVNSRNWWWTGRPDVLRFMGLQRVGHDWTIELKVRWSLEFVLGLCIYIHTHTHTHIFVGLWLGVLSYDDLVLVFAYLWGCKESDTTEHACAPHLCSPDEWLWASYSASLFLSLKGIIVSTFISYGYSYYSVSKSCLTLCDPTDYSPPGSFVHGIL